MAKTETNVSSLKVNRGTYAKIQENLAQINENELILTEDKTMPVPTTSDEGKIPVVNSNGEYELQSITIPTNLPASVITTEPTSDNTNGLIFVHLASEPTTKYNGYIYLIDEE